MPAEQLVTPLWLRAADVLTVLLGAGGLSILAFGGFRIRLAGTVITAHSGVRLLLAAVLVAAIRHYITRVPSLPARVVADLRRLWTAESVRAIFPSFVGSRLSVFVVAYLSVITLGYPTRIPFRVSDNEMVNLTARWDAGWYLGIARDGYSYDRRSTNQQNVAFFPMFPMTTSIVGIFTGGHVDEGNVRYANPARMVWTGVFLNLVALGAALGYLYRLVRAFANRDAAQAAVQLALAYPVAFVFNGMYTEGLFLLASIATFYHFGRGQLGASAVWGIIGGLTRPNGFILAAPLFAIAVARWSRLPQVAKIMDRLGDDTRPRRPLTELAVSAAPVAGMLLFSAFLYSRWGDPFLWAKLHAAWGRTYRGLEHARGPVDTMMELGVYQYTALAGMEVLHVLFFLVAVGLAIPIAWRLGLAYTALHLLTVIPPLLAGGWLSMARLTVALFPIYVYLGVTLSPAQRVAVLYIFLMLQGLGAALFFTWRPFY
jgi:hypothetical protein